MARSPAKKPSMRTTAKPKPSHKPNDKTGRRETPLERVRKDRKALGPGCRDHAGDMSGRGTSGLGHFGESLREDSATRVRRERAAATRSVKRNTKKVQRELKKRDPGGDVKL